jgi:hypothetical protein
VTDLRLTGQQARALLHSNLMEHGGGWQTTVTSPVEQWCYENDIEVPLVRESALMNGYAMEYRFRLEFKSPDSALAFKIRWL